MPFNTESEIIDAVTKRENDLRDLYTRFDDDFELYRLTPFQLGTKTAKESEYDNVTTNEPRTHADRVIDILSKSPIQIRIPLEKQGEADRKILSNAERMIYGCLNLANSRLKGMISPSIQNLLAWYSTIRGWYALKTYIYKNEKKEICPDIKVWDMRNVTYDIDDNGIAWVCHTRTVTPTQAKSEFDVGDIGSADVTIRDFLDREKNSILLGSEFAKKPIKHGLDHVPVFINMVGSTPFVASDRFTDTITDMGESLFAPNRGLFEPKSKLLTYGMTIAGLASHNPIALYSQGGKKTFQKSPYYKGSIVQFDIDKGEKADLLVQPEMPRDIMVLLSEVQRQINAGGISPVSFGEQGSQSGYAVNLLQHADLVVLYSRIKAIEEGLEWMSRELLTQFSGKNWGKLRLHGRDGTNEYFDMELSPKDIKGDWFPEVKMQPDVPQDLMAMATVARVLVEAGILSPKTVGDKYLQVQDTDLEARNVRFDRLMKTEPFMTLNAIRDAHDEGRDDVGKILWDMWMAMQGKGGSPQGQSSEGQPSTPPVQPEYATGLPSEVMPPEVMGRVQEGARLAKMGLVSGR